MLDHGHGAVALDAVLAERRLLLVFISLTTLDNDLARRLEPRASAPAGTLIKSATLTYDLNGNRTLGHVDPDRPGGGVRADRRGRIEHRHEDRKSVV